MHKVNYIGILGGTFDPPHRGHLALANAAFHSLPFQAIYFMPCKIPPLKNQAHASPQDRLAMLSLLLADHPDYHIDDRELKRKGPSYTIDSLKAWKAEDHDSTLCLLLGEDAFSQLPYWHEWIHLLDYCHLIRINRPESPVIHEPAFLNWITEHEVDRPEKLSQKKNGYILRITMQPDSLSSSKIRETLAHGEPIDEWVTEEINQYIQSHKLYDSA